MKALVISLVVAAHGESLERPSQVRLSERYKTIEALLILSVATAQSFLPSGP